MVTSRISVLYWRQCSISVDSSSSAPVRLDRIEVDGLAGSVVRHTNTGALKQRRMTHGVIFHFIGKDVESGNKAG